MEQKTERIIFRVTKNELKVIEEKVKISNLKMSEFARRTILGKKIIVIEGVENIVRELKPLRAISNNLNQLTILCHQGKIQITNIDDFEELKEKVDAIWQLLNSLMGKMKK